jgi:GT2 family glycosyltransferase
METRPRRIVQVTSLGETWHGQCWRGASATTISMASTDEASGSRFMPPSISPLSKFAMRSLSGPTARDAESESAERTALQTEASLARLSQWTMACCRITVLIATRNRVEELRGTLLRLQALSDVDQIVVVDNASTDKTWHCLRTEFPHVTSLRMPFNLGAAARTIGAMATNAAYVAFCDDDSWWEEGSLSRAADILDAHPRLAVVAAHLTVHPTGRPDPLNVAMATGLPRVANVPGVPVLGFLGCAVIVRRSAFLSAGGFDPRWHIGGEELPLALDLAAAGWELAYIEDVRAVHCPSRRRDSYTRRRTTARNDAWCAWTRRSMRGGFAQTKELLQSGLRDRAVRQGLLDAVRGAIPMLSERRPVPVGIERQLAALDAHRRRNEHERKRTLRRRTPTHRRFRRLPTYRMLSPRR